MRGRSRRLAGGLLVALLLATVPQATLARPTDGANDEGSDGYDVGPRQVDYRCGRHVCVHWVTDATSPDAPPPADRNSNGVPDWVKRTLDAFETAWKREVVEFGFRAPRDDRRATNAGPNGKLDVYLTDLADRDVGGVCRSDDPRDATVNPDSSYPYWDAAVYCVVDNDFAEADQSRHDELRLTAAHELFHAVQCAYDCYEDSWLVEGTAAWMEGRVFPRIAERTRYRRLSQLADPTVPLDSGGDRAYGAWLFWDFFAKRLDRRPVAVIRDVWGKAADAPGKPRRYSTRAAAAVARAENTTLQSVIRRFGARNSARLRTDRGVEGVTLGRSGDWQGRFLLDHLTHRYVGVRPGGRVGNSARLRVRLDLPPRRTGSAATVVTVNPDASRSQRSVRLNRRGNGALTVDFGNVAGVIVVLTNSSTRMDCNWETFFACGGYPRDDRQSYRVRVSVQR